MGAWRWYGAAAVLFLGFGFGSIAAAGTPYHLPVLAVGVPAGVFCFCRASVVDF